MKPLILFLCRGVLVLVSVVSVVALTAFLFVPMGALLNVVLGLLGVDIGLPWATAATVVVTYVALVIVLAAQNGGGDDDLPPAPGTPDAPPPADHVRTVPLSRLPVPRGLTSVDTLAEAGIPTVTLGHDLDDVAASSFLPADDDTLVSRIVATPQGPVLFIVARGSTAVGRAAGAHHALVTGAPRIPVTSNYNDHGNP